MIRYLSILTLLLAALLCTQPAHAFSFRSPPQGLAVHGTIRGNLISIPSGDYVKAFLPNSPVSGTCVFGTYDNAWSGGGTPFGSGGGCRSGDGTQCGCALYPSAEPWFYNTNLVPNGSSGFYAQAVNSTTGHVDATATVTFTVANTGPPTPTPTPTPTGTPTPTATPTATPTNTPTGTPTPTATGTPVPGSAAAFLNVLGIDDQFIASGETAAQQLDMVTYLGVRHVREDFICGDPEGCVGAGDPIGSFVSNAHTGGYTYVTQPNCVNGTVTSTLTFLTGVEQDYGDTLYLAGGCNEPNNQPFNYNNVGCYEVSPQSGQCGGGTTGCTAQGCLNFAEDYYSAMKTALPSIPVAAEPESPGPEPNNVGLQFLVNGMVTQADYADVHNYLARTGNTWTAGTAWSTFETGEGGGHDGMTGEYCGTTFGQGFTATSAANCPTVPRITTETGWNFAHGGVTEAERGDIIVSGYVAGYMRGWHTLVSVYVMFNNGADGFRLFYTPTSVVTGQFTGPSPAATDVHNLTTILSDPIKPFTPACTTVTPTGASDSTDHWITLAKSNGKCDFVFLPDRPTNSNNETITLNVTGNLYDPSVGNDGANNASASLVATNTNTFTANNRVMILEY